MGRSLSVIRLSLQDPPFPVLYHHFLEACQEPHPLLSVVCMGLMLQMHRLKPPRGRYAFYLTTMPPLLNAV